MTIFYSRERRAPAGMKFQNPRFFVVAEPKVKKVVVDGDYPAIVEAYKAVGATVETYDPKKHGQPGEPAAEQPAA